MCGICGYTGKKDQKIMNKMLETLYHRGPDDSGRYLGDNINLGMVRLSIIDPAGGHQPRANEDNTVSVVFNGEIYNHIEMRRDLESKGHRFSTLSDTEVIVHGYEEYGMDLPKRLNGMFAIAIWDTSKKRLILFRDRFGIKPLFYAVKSKKLIFGSEIKSVLCHSIVSRGLDREALSHYFALRNIPAPFTAYKEIRSLLPGHFLVWDGGEVNISRWYAISMETKWNDKDEDILVDKLDEILNDSVKLRLRSDVGYGAYLSGGIDSSMIVAIMSKYSAKPVKTFTLSYADSPSHKMDSYYARKVSQLYSTDHHEYKMRWTELRDEMPDIIRHLDQPFAGVISSYWLSRFMSKHLKVALSGDGADDLFASYGHHRLVGAIGDVQKSMSDGGSHDGAALGFFHDRKDFVCGLSKYEPWQWRLAYASFMEHEKDMLFSDRGRDIFTPYSTSDFLKNIYLGCDKGADDLNKMLYLDINTLLPNEILYFNDMLSMANSMEVRTPYLDYRFAELACSIPGSMKIKDMNLKYILRKVAARYLPKDIIERPKEGFVLPKNTWLREGLLPLLEDTLSTERLAAHGYFNEKYIRSVVKKFLSGDDSMTFKIITLMVFQIWHENNVGEMS